MPNNINVPYLKTIVCLFCLQYNFMHPASGLKVNREDFMRILVDLQALHIRASYYSQVAEIRFVHSGRTIPNNHTQSIEQYKFFDICLEIPS